MTKAPQFPMNLVMQLQRQAVQDKKCFYLLHLAKWESSDKQPSRFRTHWKIDPAGKLWKHTAPGPDTKTDTVKIKYIPA